MKINMLEYNKMLINNNISIIYSGPLWAEGIDGMAEFIQRRLDKDELTLSASQSVFSVFVEQLNNMLMYSVNKEQPENTDKPHTEASKGIFLMGKHDHSYFLQTGNYMKTSSVELLKSRIDHLNTLDKQQLRQFFKEQRKIEDNNPESKGGGIGLIEVARRATSKIDYDFIPCEDGITYFTMYVTI
ncbi:MAG: SiaB family protein kinase [Defluviitaleaceae bacterium]|nr:SiaB family protein kinase [Defluviitaleaceae bacterium]